LINCPICKNQDTACYFSKSDKVLSRYGFLSEVSKNVTRALDQELFYCSVCSFAWNSKFDYSLVNYDSDDIIEAGNFSENYITYQKQSANEIEKQIGRELKTVVEIGAGAGIFLNEINAVNKIAIEPSHEAHSIPEGIEVHNKYFTEDAFNLDADLVVMRQVLEHIPNPIEFLQSLKNSFMKKDEFYLYIEVPNAALTFRDARFYDYYYEHCNYFTIPSLISLTENLNMNICSINSSMDDEIISILMTASTFKPQILSDSLDKKIHSISSKINYFCDARKKIIAWGASGNGVQLLNSLNIGTDTIEFVIDSDPNKENLYIPGTLQKIILPSTAIGLNPDVVMVFSQIHKNEIGKQCKELFKNVEIFFTD